MKINGFSVQKRCFYCIYNDLAYCVELEMPSNLVYVTCYIIPLYMPTEFRYFTYGMRLKEVLPIANISTTELEQWCDQLEQCLQRIVFPMFQKAQTPDSFLKLVNEGLFEDAFHIPEIDVHRLRIFTALYKKDTPVIPKLCDDYENALTNTTYLTDQVKKRLFEEIEKVRDSISRNTQENEALTIDIIKKTKQHCFGCK